MIGKKIQEYQRDKTGEHDRERSWEHCYGYFRRTAPGGLAGDRHHAALQLAFYLASWGMYRGSGFLLQHAYTIHLGVIDVLGDPHFSVLWEREFGAGEKDGDLVPRILEVATAIRESYRPFAPAAESRQASDTLVTKIILGTLGCLPACDTYFIKGFRSAKLSYSWLNARLVEQVLGFCREHLEELRQEQARIGGSGGVRYPLMKLVDMYFLQIGSEG